jgi:hypothetical protein
VARRSAVPNIDDRDGYSPPQRRPSQCRLLGAIWGKLVNFGLLGSAKPPS